MEPEKKSNGALFGLIVILIILIIGGIYVWQSKMKSALEGQNIQSENVTPADSDELNTLEQDLNSIDTSVDAGIETVE
jgi:ABC-type Na+ efflux pump permease subunit